MKHYLEKNSIITLGLTTMLLSAFLVINSQHLNLKEDHTSIKSPLVIKEQEKQVLNPQHQISNVKNDLPDGYHVMKVSATHTDYIGTPDHPTIDGGIVNAADGIPINHDNPDAKSISVNVKEEQGSALSTSNSQKAFQDNWATSERVKKLLTSAAEQGKLDYVLKKSDQMGLPASVAVVPMVESNYKTQALSPKGAAGAWQLMPSTAKDYGVKNQDRFQFTTSTDAALKLLNELHQHYGNWELAFAAYNAGSKRVDDALQKNPKAKTIDDLNLPQETKDYVKKIMGLNKTMMELSTNAT